jgi:hypothetical protein
VASQEGPSVLYGFEAAAKVASQAFASATHVSGLASPSTIEEFGIAFLHELRRVAARGGTVRVIAAGSVSQETIQVLGDAGVAMRELAEPREVGLFLTDHEMLLFPSEMRPESPLTQVAVHLPDLVATAHFQLAFERAWSRAKPVLAAR